MQRANYNREEEFDLEGVSASNWLPDGWHDVQVTEMEDIETNEGTRGKKLTLVGRDGSKIEHVVWTTKKGGTEINLKGIKIFALQTGLFGDANCRFSFSQVLGKGFTIKVGRSENEKYGEVKEIRPLGSRPAESNPSPAPAQQRPAPPAQQPQRRPAPATGEGTRVMNQELAGGDTEDDLPF